MGEQSAKHLRGRAMDDVIFAGSESRGPAGLAEVSLTFDARAMPGDGRAGRRALGRGRPEEVVVTRRLYRDGNSEYLLGGVPCRLRDITDFFLGTGVGTKAYSIIEQGRIGLIVSSRPEDRRALIDEAAGITKYKAKKKLAERRMEPTRQNLLRVSRHRRRARQAAGLAAPAGAEGRALQALQERAQGPRAVVRLAALLGLLAEEKSLTTPSGAVARSRPARGRRLVRRGERGRGRAAGGDRGDDRAGGGQGRAVRPEEQGPARRPARPALRGRGRGAGRAGRRRPPRDRGPRARGPQSRRGEIDELDGRLPSWTPRPRSGAGLPGAGAASTASGAGDLVGARARLDEAPPRPRRAHPRGPAGVGDRGGGGRREDLAAAHGGRGQQDGQRRRRRARGQRAGGGRRAAGTAAASAQR